MSQMAQLQYMPGDPRLVDQLVYELKSKGIFDQFRKECISDVDTRPAYQNLRQRVETSVATFLSRQCWKPDLNKNQLREKLRKHILDGNYLEQGVERIVDQVVNPKVASVFIPQVEDLVYNYLGIPRKKASEPETTDNKPIDLLPTDLEAVSPGSVKSNDDKNDDIETDNKVEKMEVDVEDVKEDEKPEPETKDNVDIEMSEMTVKSNDSESLDKSSIPLPSEEIKLENIPAPENSPPKASNANVELEKIALPYEPNLSTDIPLPEETSTTDKESYFKPIHLQSEDSNSSSDSSLRRNMSPLTPIRNFNNENSCDAQQGFDDDSDNKPDEQAASSTFRFTIETKDDKSRDINSDTTEVKEAKKEDQVDLSYQFNNQVNINTFNTPMYDDSSNSNNLHIDYESDVNSKTNIEIKPEVENSQDSKKDKKSDDKKSSHKSSHRSRDSSRHSSSKDKRSDSKHSTSRESSKHDKKSSSKDDKSKSSKERDRSRDRSERKDSRDSSKHRTSHKSSNSKDKDSKSHRSSSHSHRHSSKSSDERKSSSSSKEKEKTSDSSRDKSKDKSRDSKSSSSREKERKSSSSSSKKSDEKNKKKDKKDVDDHYSLSGRGNHNRRSTDRDSNDGSSSSKGSQNHNGSKSTESKKDNKSSSSKSDNTSTSGESPSPSDKEHIVKDNSKISQFKPIVRVDNHLETPIATPPRLPFVPDITIKKPRFAANLQEAKKLMKMRKFLDEEQKRMNQEAALLLEFQANVRPNLSQVYSSISGPELEFACVSSAPVQDSVPYEVANVQNVGNVNMEEQNSSAESENVPNAAQISEIIGVQCPTGDEQNIVLNEVVIEDMDNEIIQEEVNSHNTESTSLSDDKNDNTYDENKPFSELMDEISEYSKASEIKTKADNEDKSKSEEITENVENTEIQDVECIEVTETTNAVNTENKYFEVTIITEELSESEEIDFEPKDEETEDSIESQIARITESDDQPLQTNVETKEENTTAVKENITTTEAETIAKPSYELQYFAEHEKYNAELERHEFSSFLKKYTESLNTNNKIFVINCDTYEESIVKEIASTMGDFEVINYYKNGHLKLPNTTTNIIKDVALTTEITLPIETTTYEIKSPIFSPVKSECSFELCNDFDTKLEDINKKSRQEVMEIILGSVVDSSPSKMPKIDYYTESAMETETEDVTFETDNQWKSTEVEREIQTLKRRIDEIESTVNNNRSVLTPKKMRKMSDSDLISSTTEESEELSNNNKVPAVTRSKYLGRAKRVGLPRPKRSTLPNSPSSDKSVENYVQNTPPSPAPSPGAGKVQCPPRNKVQRYDTSDLYKPKLHYPKRRHHVT